MPEEKLENELEFLREECNRLRNERDLARKELRDADLAREDESSLRLKLLSETLIREVKERFWGTLRTGLWITTLLVGIATAGGLWKLSDIVTERVNDKIKEKEKDVAQIRQQIIQSVVDFERQAQKSLEQIEKLRVQVATESDRATGEIRQAKARMLALEISVHGEKVTVSASAPEGVGVRAWFGRVASGTAAVAGSQADKHGFEDPKTWSGAFSSRFQTALRADTNQDGAISIAEAAELTRNVLKRDGFDQTPMVAGCANDIPLFSTDVHKLGAEKYRSV